LAYFEAHYFKINMFGKKNIYISSLVVTRFQLL